MINQTKIKKEFNLSEKIVEKNGRQAIHPSYVKEFIRLLKEFGCDKEVDVIEDDNGDGDVIICGEYVIRKSNGERVLRLCQNCEERNIRIDKLAGEKLK